MYVTHALQQNGVTVVKRPYTSSINFRSLRRAIELHEPDVVLFSKASASCYPELIGWCRNRGILTVAWIWDLYFGYRPQRPPQFLSDILFTTDGGHDGHWKEIGANHRVLRQGIHGPDCVMFRGDYRYDVAFIGSGASYRGRGRLLAYLHSTFGHRMVHYNDVRGIDLNRALSHVKIVVGDSYPSSGYWSNRIYEITGRGGFFIHPTVDGMEEEYTDGEHYASYPRGDRAKTTEIIRHYIDANEERERIRAAGFEHTGTHFTYESRVKELLEAIRTENPKLKPPQVLLPEGA